MNTKHKSHKNKGVILNLYLSPFQKHNDEDKPRF